MEPGGGQWMSGCGGRGLLGGGVRGVGSWCYLSVGGKGYRGGVNLEEVRCVLVSEGSKYGAKNFKLRRGFTWKYK